MNENDRREEPLTSWKEIGAYIGRNDATARRWEKEEGLPVHRQSHKGRASVYAFPSEIDAWRASRKVVREPEPLRPLWKMPAFAVTMAMCLVMVGNGLRPQVASAQGAGPVTRQVWAGPKVNTRGTVSPDGRYLSFQGDNGDLAIHDFTTGQNRLLTDAGTWGTNNDVAREFVSMSAISRDGKQVAYGWTLEFPRPGKDPYSELRLIDLNGGKPRG